MDKTEDMLLQDKSTIENIEAPADLEERLQNALNRKKKKLFPYKRIAAIAIVFVFLFSYSFDAIAFYSKKLLGYDEVITGSLKEINEKGQGQRIDKSYTFSDGTMIVIDAIFFDDNELTVLYTETKNKTSDQNYNAHLTLEGLFHDYPQKSGKGISNEDATEVKWVVTFEPPNAFEKWLDFKVRKPINGNLETGKISFTLDRNKALKYTFKQSINKTIDIEGNKIKFDNITVSPMSTLIKGTIIKHTNKFFSNESSNVSSGITFHLIADGKPIPSQGGGNNRDEFEWEFDGIHSANKLELADIQLENTIMVDEEYPVTTNTTKIDIGLRDQLFSITDIYTKEGKTYLLIHRKENVAGVLGLFSSDKQIHMLSSEIKSRNPNTNEVMELRTYDSGELPDKLAVKVLVLSKKYNGTIQIPVK